MTIPLPTVVPDIDAWISSIDGSIRLGADANEFSYDVSVGVYDSIGRIPQDVYVLVDHYTKRGFLCKYNGEAGTLNIAWDHPNMTYQDVTNTTRANSSLILTIGDGFPASKLYLCMTNGVDLRLITDITLTRSLRDQIQKASVDGENETTLRFDGVSQFVIQSLFRVTFQDLHDSGFSVNYDSTREVFVIRWDIGDLSIDTWDGSTLGLSSLS